MSTLVLIFYALLVVALFRVFSLWILSIGYSFRHRPQTASSSRVSVIVPAYNEEKSIEPAIKSLLEQDYANYEVILVDDGSTDGTVAVARGLEGPILRVLSTPNRGKAEALNTGIAASNGDIVVTVDADTRLNKGALTSLAARFEADSKIGAVAGNVKVDRPSGLLQRLQEVEYTTGIGLTRKGQSMLSTVMIVPGPIAAFRRAAVAEAGGFSSDTFAEDFDMTLGILKKRHRVEYEDTAVAYTIAPLGIENLIKQRRRWYRGMMQVLGKNEGMLFRPRYGVAGLYGIPYMWYDTVAPLVNLFLALFAVLAGSVTGDWAPVVLGLGSYWALQTVVAVSAILLDRERKLRQILVSPLLMLYSTFLDGVRTGAFIEEVLSLKMKWEKPGR
ncbi:MAG: glycosyltransferase family 2 protein [archaeon]|nr:MAG: glycosyltransferase family 2 protein [archaeon]